MFARLWPRILIYQIFNRVLFSLFILPVFYAAGRLIMRTAGFRYLTDSMLPRFLMKPEGWLIILGAVALLMISAALELGGLVSFSDRYLRGKEQVSYLTVYADSIKRLPSFLELGVFPLALYIGILAPLSGIGVRVSPLQRFRIPEFLLGGLKEHSWGTALYFALIALFIYLCLRFLFAIHFIVLANHRPGKALADSWRLTGKYLRRVVSERLRLYAGFFGVLIAGSFAWELFLSLCIEVFGEMGRTSGLFAFLYIIQIGGGLAASFAGAAFLTMHSTTLFRELLAKEPELAGERVIGYRPSREKPSRLDFLFYFKKRTIAVFFLCVMIGASVPLSVVFRHLAVLRPIEVMGHRGGGGPLFPENSAEVIRFAGEVGIPWVEIDIQRTKDGHYVLLHDATFKRVAGVKKKPSDMTLAEIKRLTIGRGAMEVFRNARVPTLEEALDAAGEFVSLNIELKGPTADRRMADDVARIVREKGMQKRVVLTSFNLDVIGYIDDNYDDIPCGAIFFLAYGDERKIKADWLSVEEQLADEKLFQKAHDAGKKVMVWTVDSTASIEHFAFSNADAIITDRPIDALDVLATRGALRQEDLLFHFFFRRAIP